MCDREIQVQRYYDGELTPAQRAAVEAHLAECGECRELLAELEKVSAMVRTSPRVALSSEAREDIKQLWTASRERGVLRIAEWLTAAAAAVLIGGLLAWPSETAEAGTGVPEWEAAALVPPTEMHDPANRELLVAAQWMAEDLSSGERR